MTDRFEIFRVGTIRKQGRSVRVEINEKYKDALLGLDQFSHIIVYFWFHKNDTPEERNVLQIYPRGKKENPWSGVFATRSPKRPNLIGMFTCKILSVEGNIIHVDKTDAFDGTPVIDVKPYIPKLDVISEVRVPEWVKK
jgi:tRNA-Thr(GGU) m(6)t(6)A37 methyltransferase TsaA